MYILKRYMITTGIVNKLLSSRMQNVGTHQVNLKDEKCTVMVGHNLTKLIALRFVR